MRPGDTVQFVVYRQTAAGAASTGKVLADFNVVGYKDGVVTSMSPAIASIGTGINWQAYKLSLTLPASGPYQFACLIEQASGTDIVSPQFFSGEVEQQDIDSIYDVASRPTASLTSSTLLASQIQLEMIAYRECPLSISIVDQAGTAIDLSGYNNWKFSVWDKTHSGSILYTAAASLAGSAGGTVTALIPEDAAFFSQIANAFTASEDFVTLYYDIIADAAATSSKTRTICRGTLILWRYEGAA